MNKDIKDMDCWELGYSIIVCMMITLIVICYFFGDIYLR